MIILGIDPGLTHLGYAVLERGDGGRIALLDIGCVAPPFDVSDADTTTRLLEWRAAYQSKWLLDRARMWGPHLMVWERLTFVQHLSSAAKLSCSHGVVMCAKMALQIPSYTVSTIEARKAFIGVGCEKKDVVEWAERRFGAAALIHVKRAEREHAADAALIAAYAERDAA